MTKIITILSQADRIDLIRYITKQRTSSGELYTPHAATVSLSSLNEMMHDVLKRSGHPAEHISIEADTSIEAYRVAAPANAPATITIADSIIQQAPYLALYLSTLGTILVLLRRYGPHRYSQDQEIIIAAHASVLLGYGVLGINAYHEERPKYKHAAPLTVVNANQYSHWLGDYVERHHLGRFITPHLLPAASKSLDLDHLHGTTSDPLIHAQQKAHSEKRQKHIIVTSAVILSVLLVFSVWSITPKPLSEEQLTQLRRIEQARQAYDVCRDELRAMSNINQRDILSSRSLQAKHRSCELLRRDHNKLVRDF